MNDDDKLDNIMNRWESGFAADPQLHAKVQSRIARAAKEESRYVESFSEWIRVLLGRPSFALGYAGLFALVGIGFTTLFLNGVRKAPDELTLSYRLTIDPLYRLETVAGAVSPGSPAKDRADVMHHGLGWLQGELDLSNNQFERVSALHTRYEQAFDEVFLSLVDSHAEYREIDKRRMSSDVIDYLHVFELLETQKRLSEQSAKLTSELLDKVAEIITPEQQERYRRLLDNLYPNAPRTVSEKTNA